MKTWLAALLCATAGTSALCAPAFAQNALGFYVGAGVGGSTVRSDRFFDAYGYGYDGLYNSPDHHFAWKAIAGIRPVSLAGAEVEYIDFGHPGGDGSYYDYYANYGPDSHPRALAAFGVGHLPLPVPFIDIFAKVGAARLHTNVNQFDGPNCVYSNQAGCGQPVTSTAQSHWDTRFAYGAGVQSTIWGLALRAEYERINSPYGDPDLLSVSALWTF